MFTDFAHNTVPGKQSRNNVVDKIVKGVIEGGDDAQHTQRAIFDPRTFVDHDPSGRSFLFAQHLFTVVNHPLNFFTGGQHFTCKKEWHNFKKKEQKKKKTVRLGTLTRQHTKKQASVPTLHTYQTKPPVLFSRNHERQDEQCLVGVPR